ncbi:hypothetical protein LTR37_016234 [Vermiconidia calcicola]|uniref:Uncharacterized protein n=1 Tax=Vermiconidia calcicola TaxID=1690605 RepID=A0ACC3MNF2_9PEZI|nr:hypothetical protein LTR37_016234 [Vermiconidia calcicola]
MTTLEERSFDYDNNGKQKTTCYLTGGPENGPLMVFVHGWPAIGKVWTPQLQTFSSLGFKVVAPDMPGYGKSTADKDLDDYTQENINLGMLALLDHLGRDQAIWIAHDWGCGAAWSFAAHYPSKCLAVACLTIPYRSVELGLEQLVDHGINRSIYPADEYPYGQWDYQHFYETSFERASEFFDANCAAFLKVGYSKGDSANFGKVAFTANVSRDGGWLGGDGKKLQKMAEDMPLEDTVLDEETYTALVEAMQRTGFWGADAWYANHARNRKYTLEKSTNNGDLHMPILFIHARFDSVCATTTTPGMCKPMRRHCRDLTEVSIDAGHWVAEEKPAEVSAAIARWLVERCKEQWPGFWANGHVRRTT